MMKVLGKGLNFLKQHLTKENFEFLGSQLKSFNGDFSNSFYSEENKEEYCQVIELDYLTKQSLLSLVENYGNKNFSKIALLKGKYDDFLNQRVFFIQKLNEENEPVNSNEIFCICVNNVDAEIFSWFKGKEMMIIKF